MSSSVVLTPEAESDVVEAYGWYETRRRGLGEEFVNCVEACLESVGRRPALHPIVFAEYRRAIVRRFPYAVFYESTRDKVIVYGVLHTARDPEKWRQRLS